MKATFLDFEQPIAELEAKIDELRGRAPSAAAVHARLRQARLHRLRGAARRSRLRRRSLRGRRPGALQRPGRDGDRPPEGARHQGEDPAQLRHAAAGGLPQGDAAHAPGGEVRHSGADLRRHAGRVSGHRRGGARAGGGHRPQPLRHGRAQGADRLHRDRRGRLGRRARDRGGRSRHDAPVRHLFGDLARGLRLHPVAQRRHGARCAPTWRPMQPRRWASPPTG